MAAPVLLKVLRERSATPPSPRTAPVVASVASASAVIIAEGSPPRSQPAERHSPRNVTTVSLRNVSSSSSKHRKGKKKGKKKRKSSSSSSSSSKKKKVKKKGKKKRKRSSSSRRSSSPSRPRQNGGSWVAASNSGGYGEPLVCSVHGKRRTAMNLTSDRKGGLRCLLGSECNGGSGGGVKGGGKAADWTCLECGDEQFARNMECRKCGVPKPGSRIFNDRSASAPFPRQLMAGSGSGTWFPSSMTQSMPGKEGGCGMSGMAIAMALAFPGKGGASGSSMDNLGPAAGSGQGADGGKGCWGGKIPWAGAAGPAFSGGGKRIGGVAWGGACGSGFDGSECDGNSGSKGDDAYGQWWSQM